MKTRAHDMLPAAAILVAALALVGACKLDATGAAGGASTTGSATSSDSSSTGAPPSCDDGQRNGAESDVDCGGDCRACAYGAACVTSADCEAECILGECAPRTSTAWRSIDVQGPSGRRSFTMTRDRTSHAVLFGGVREVGTPPVTEILDDFYRYEGTSWTPIPKAPMAAWPTPRHSAAAAYETKTYTTLLFGGAGADVYQDLWSWDGSTWTEWKPADAGDPTPEARFAASFTYDPTRNVAVLFGGFTKTGVIDDTWVFDLGTAPGHWTKIDPPAHPSARFAASMTFEGQSERVMLFGGSDGAAALDDQWAFDGSTWQEVKPEVRPSRRVGASIARDPIRDRVVLAGGSFYAGLYGDTWEWDGAAWTETSSPGVGQVANGMDFDDASKRMVLFLSFLGTSTLVSETWEHFGVGELCSASSACQSGLCVNSVCCLEPKCGECSRCDTPLASGFCAPDPAGCP